MGEMKFAWLIGLVLVLVGCSALPDGTAPKSDPPVAEVEVTGIDLLELSAETREGIEQARRELPEFWRAWEGNEWGKGDYIVNVQFMDEEGKGEFLWMSVEARGEGEITGVLEGPPRLEIGHKVGDRLTVKESDVVDWMFLPEEGDFRGGYTLKALGTEPE
jgi:uncharacterized protein YegJ (DUF2314 family)